MAGNSSCLSALTSVTFLLLLILSSAEAARAKEGTISPFCTTAITEADDKAICTRLVNGAKTWPEAMSNAVKGVIEIAKKAKPMVNGLERKMPPGLFPETVESVVAVCKETYDNYVYYLEECVGLVNKPNDPASSLETYLGGSTFSGCQNAFEEIPLSNSEVDRFHEATRKYANILLSIYQQKQPPQQH